MIRILILLIPKRNLIIAFLFLGLAISNCALTPVSSNPFDMDMCTTQLINDTDDPFDPNVFMKQVELSKRRCKELFGPDSCLVELRLIGYQRWLAKCRTIK